VPSWQAREQIAVPERYIVLRYNVNREPLTHCSIGLQMRFQPSFASTSRQTGVRLPE
jgi:hypothetical protein